MANVSDPWFIPGPETRRTAPGLEHALALHHRAERRKPNERDRPPPSTFPMTAAARAALNGHKLGR
jgi:hypothetical protein